jgi:hypothetical protein
MNQVYCYIFFHSQKRVLLPLLAGHSHGHLFTSWGSLENVPTQGDKGGLQIVMRAQCNSGEGGSVMQGCCL